MVSKSPSLSPDRRPPVSRQPSVWGREEQGAAAMHMHPSTSLWLRARAWASGNNDDGKLQFWGEIITNTPPRGSGKWRRVWLACGWLWFEYFRSWCASGGLGMGVGMGYIRSRGEVVEKRRGVLG